jgi:YCII-related domain
MSNYAFSYYGEPNFKSQEDGKNYMAKWQAWVGDLGDALVNPVTPLKSPKTVSASGVTENSVPNRLSGYAIVKADSMDAALEMAKGCPHLDHGTIDVAEVFEM